MAHETTPLTDMLRKGAKVIWTAEAEKGVRACIRRLAEEPVLAYPDFGKPFVVTTDASSYALGAVLAQEEEKGERPIAYISRRLTPTEERYSAIERELLGVVWAVDMFRPYVYGRHFTIVTDHKPLQWVGGMKESSARIGRWKERLMSYSYTIRHTPGKSNVIADWLSRAIEACAVEEEPGAGPSLRQFFQEWDPEREENSESERDVSREEGGRIEEVDEVINKRKHQIRWKTKTQGLELVDTRREGRNHVYQVETTPGIPKERIGRILKDILRPGKTYYLHVGNEVVWKKLAEMYKAGDIGEGSTLVRCAWLATTVLDEEQQWEIARSHHVGKTNHRGAAEMVAALRRRYYWKGMRGMAEKVVAECVTCGKVKANTRPPVAIQQMTPTAKGPLQFIEVDTFTWRGFSWVTVVDTFSKLAMAKMVDRKLSEAVRDTLREWSLHYGTPERVTSDGGREFRNAEVEEEARKLEIQWHFTTPGHTQGRGCIERLHGTLSDHLRVITADQDVDVPTAMVRAVIGYNHAVHSVTGYTPVELVFGGAFRQRDARATAAGGAAAEDIEAHRIAVRKGWRTAGERITEEKARRVLQHNVRTTDASGRITLGTTVYRRIATNRRKEPQRYTGPYKIVAILENNRYTLESIDHPGRRRVAHIQQLKIPVQKKE